MKSPLYWVPILHLDWPDPSFQRWRASRHLRAHGGVGHVVLPSPAGWPAESSYHPLPGVHWYCRRWEKVLKRAKPTAATVEIPLPMGLDDPAMALLDRVMASTPVQRLVLTRPPSISLDRALIPLATLLDSITDNIWLDVGTWGWDAVSYLTAWDDRLQLIGLADTDLPQLLDLGHLVSRPPMLWDWSLGAPRPIPPLPHYGITRDAPRAPNYLLMSGRND